MGPHKHRRMMGRSTISAPGFEAGRQQAAPRASRSRRFLLIAVVLSVGVHLLAALLIVFLPRVPPRGAAPRGQGTVELLMVEQKGDQPSQVGQTSDSQPAPAQAEKAEASKAETPNTQAPKPEAPKADVQKEETSAPEAVAAPPVTRPGDEPALPPAEQAPPKPAKEDPQPPPKQAAAQPAPPRSQEAPVFDLAGTESESNAIVLGGNILPASPDNRFRNRPPVYPVEAQIHNQHGSVVVVIHVSENGVAAGIDVLESSGVDILDQAAVAAVARWHFRPAMKDGKTVPFDMPFRFIFEPY